MANALDASQCGECSMLTRKGSDSKTTVGLPAVAKAQRGPVQSECAALMYCGRQRAELSQEGEPSRRWTLRNKRLKKLTRDADGRWRSTFQRVFSVPWHFSVVFCPSQYSGERLQSFLWWVLWCMPVIPDTGRPRIAVVSSS